MGARQYLVGLKGERPLLMHADNYEWSEFIKKWQLANKTKSVAGDDRTPAWCWIGYIHNDGKRVVIPSDNLMTMLREGGARVLTGKGQKTFKAQTQSGILVDDLDWPLLVGDNPIPYAPIRDLINNEDFELHQLTAEDLGFKLFIKRAAIGEKKHLRVRPRFNKWACQGTVTVFDDMITTQKLEEILNQAGTYCGIGDWRPSSKTAGQFGVFTATVKQVG